MTGLYIKVKFMGIGNKESGLFVQGVFSEVWGNVRFLFQNAFVRAHLALRDAVWTCCGDLHAVWRQVRCLVVAGEGAGCGPVSGVHVAGRGQAAPLLRGSRTAA